MAPFFCSRQAQSNPWMITSSNNRYPPGDLAIWIFILAELGVFALFFSAYAFARAGNVGLFNTYQLTLNHDAALIKGQLIGDYFMGLRSVSGIWRWVILLWLFIPGGLIATAFYMAS